MNAKLITSRRAIVRVAHAGRVRYGLYSGKRIRLYDGSPFAGGQPGKDYAPVGEARLLAPCRPSKVVCVGRNYAAHAKELGNPVLDETPIIFMKPSTTVIGPGETIVRPAGATRVDHESELAVVIGRRSRGLTQDNALTAVLGYTCLNDVTERDMQNADGQWTRAKGFDTFCPLGPAIALDLDPKAVAVRCLLDGKVRQKGNTKDFIFPLPRLLEFITSVMTLNAGDVVATGTPAGVGPMVAGQEVAVEIDGIGRLVNPVRDA